MPRYIDLTPTWREAATIIAAALENGTGEGRDAARRELFRMAEILTRLTAEPSDAEPSDDTDQLVRLREALSTGGEACDLGAIRLEDQSLAHAAFETLWAVAERAQEPSA